MSVFFIFQNVVYDESNKNVRTTLTGRKNSSIYFTAFDDGSCRSLGPLYRCRGTWPVSPPLRRQEL